MCSGLSDQRPHWTGEPRSKINEEALLPCGISAVRITPNYIRQTAVLDGLRQRLDSLGRVFCFRLWIEMPSDSAVSMSFIGSTAYTGCHPCPAH
jgi:hypothetical protein